jgi:hypothetical protein
MSELAAIEAALKQIGLAPDDVTSMLDPGELEAASTLDRVTTDDLVTVVRRAAPALDAGACNTIVETFTAQLDLMSRVYAGAVGVYLAQQNLRKNAQVGLFGNNAAPGALYAPGTIMALQPKQSGVLSGSDFAFLPEYTFFRLFAEDVDAAAGWTIVGNTMKFSDEIVSGVRGDCPLTSITADVDAEESPLASMFKRSPKTTVTFTVSIRLDNAAEQPFRGLTLEFADATCRRPMQIMSDNLGDLNFAGLVEMVMNVAKARISRRGITVSQPSRQVLVRPAARPLVGIGFR